MQTSLQNEANPAKIFNLVEKTIIMGADPIIRMVLFFVYLSLNYTGQNNFS